MKRGFRFKVIMSFLGAVALLIFLIILFSNIILRPILIRDSENTIKNYGEMITDVYLKGSNTVSKTMTMIKSSHDIETVIITEDMKVLLSASDIFPDSSKMEFIRSWIEDYKISDIDSYCKEIYNQKDNLKRLVYIEQIKEGEYLVMSKVIKGTDQLVNLSLTIITVESVIIGIIGVFICIIMTKPFITQVEKMSRITKNMAQLNFDEKINYKSRDEVGVLADSIDEMSDELSRSIDKLKTDVERRKRLIRDISHELKTPVTTIRGYTESIQVMSENNPRISRYCDIMVEECEVIDGLVSEMLYMSKLESDGYMYEKELIDLALLKERLSHRICNECPSDKISVDFEQRDIFGSFLLIERGVFNYILNAVKYCDKDTDIFVRGIAKEKSYVFSVANYGREISEENLELIWDVFYKNDKARTRSDKGHGIGLAIVRQIAVLHKGRAWAESDNGINTFYLEIPL